MFQHDDAIKNIQIAKNKEKKNILYNYLESNIYFSKAFLYETTEDRQNYTKRFEQWEKSLKSGNKQSPYYRYCLSNLYLQRAMLSLKHGDFLKAGIDIRRANKMLEENAKQFPAFIIQNKELGLIHAFIGTIPQQYTWLLNLTGFSGNISQGESEIMTLFNASIHIKEFEFLQTESFLSLSILANVLHFEKETFSKLLAMSEKISSIYKKSPLYIFARATLFIKSGNNEAAVNELRKYNSSQYQIRFDYLDYMHGLILLQRNDRNAVNFLYRYVNNFKGIHNIKSAYQKIAWYYLIFGETEKYEHYMNIVKIAGNALNESDKQAHKEALNNTIPHPQLLQARLLSDGGYYEQAIEVIESIDSAKLCENLVHCVELLYRKARTYHLQSSENHAIRLYTETIVKGKELKEYFAANSALMLGNIYETQQNNDEAIRYYNICLSLPFEEYRGSIQQKAKAGLQRLQ